MSQVNSYVLVKMLYTDWSIKEDLQKRANAPANQICFKMDLQGRANALSQSALRKNPHERAKSFYLVFRSNVRENQRETDSGSFTVNT